jgi:CheY-like chemotaxis protein
MGEPHAFELSFPGTTAALVVDDVGIVRKLTFRLLSEAGFRVFEAASAVEALEVLHMARGRIDLILVDVVLGEVNGVDLVRLIRERWSDPQIVFMSAHPAEVLVREGLEDPTVVFLAKPFTRDELMVAIGRALQATRSRREASGARRPGKP